MNWHALMCNVNSTQYIDGKCPIERLKFASHLIAGSSFVCLRACEHSTLSCSARKQILNVPLFVPVMNVDRMNKCFGLNFGFT